VWRSLWDQLSRPLQIESLPGSFFETFGHPEILASHGSLNLGGHGTIETGLVIFLGVVLAALWGGFARGTVESGRLVRFSAAAVCAVMIFGKVLSPQFMIWLVPLVPMVRGKRGLRASVLLAIALVATQAWFPNRYYSYVYHGHLAWLVFARNLLLIAILALLALPVVRRRPSVVAPTPRKKQEIAEVRTGTMA
jgi:hypothetical protein